MWQCGEQRQAAGRQDDSEQPRVARQDASIRERPPSCSPHQPVRIALRHLIEHGRAGCHQRRTRDGLQHRGPRSARRAEIVARCARGDDEQVEPRFGEAEVIAGRPPGGSRDRNRRGVCASALHARTPFTGVGSTR